MFAGRIGAIVYTKRKNMKYGRRRRLSEEEIDRLKKSDCINFIFVTHPCLDTSIEDMDIKENSTTKIKFRKVPYSAWIMGLIFWFGAALTIYFIKEEIIAF